MTKEKMVELLDQQIKKQNKFVLEDRKEGRQRLEIMRQGMRNGLVLAKIILKDHWDEE